MFTRLATGALGIHTFFYVKVDTHAERRLACFFHAPFAPERGHYFSTPYLAVTCSVFVASAVQDCGLFREMASGSFPHSALCLVRRWIHAHASVHGVLGLSHVSTCRWTSDPEVQSTEASGRISCVFHVKMDSDPVSEVPALFAHGNLNIISTCTSYDVRSCFFAVFYGIFRTPSIWASSPRGSPQRPTVVGFRGLGVAGTPGV